MIVAIDVQLGRVLLGTTELPGLFRGLTVSHEAVMDEKKRANRSGVSKRSKGFNDVEVRLQLGFYDGPTSSAHEKIAATRARFYTLDAKGQPIAVHLVHPTVQAHGLDLVVATRFSTGERNDSDEITAAIEFTQWRPLPAVVKREGKPFEKLLLRGAIELDYYARNLADAKARILGAPETQRLAGTLSAAGDDIGQYIDRSTGYADTAPPPAESDSMWRRINSGKYTTPAEPMPWQDGGPQ
ncbi:MAG: hypothetical protein IV100_12620 [Myxococcales bacterium]|uniref:hypothetical protein n=1 Tax=Sediminibacterium sp. TaxID=1917865 RepID=UPI001D348CC4|nr:hypothetical protein [Sediminibacterium sp.]MBT9485842.1 hypothetical protein [Sediminibacterium sp.]MBT9556870.1 hypothetical protein [Myxococcales bacterium]